LLPGTVSWLDELAGNSERKKVLPAGRIVISDLRKNIHQYFAVFTCYFFFNIGKTNIKKPIHVDIFFTISERPISVC